MNDKVEVRGGTLEEGLANGRHLLAEHPEAALTQARALLKLGPEPRILRLAAAAHRKLGETVAAEAAELAAIKQSLSDGSLSDAATAELDGRSGEASALAAEHLREQPDDLLAMTISAESAITLRRLTEGEALLRIVLERAPSFLRASIMLAKSLMLQSRMAEAMAVINEVIARKPNNLTAIQLLAQLRSETRDYEGAAAGYERILPENDDSIELWVTYADSLRFLGRAMDSRLAYQRALVLDGGSGSAWWGITNLDPAAVSDDEIARMEQALAERADQPEDAGQLHFALGGVFDKRGRYADAFSHFAEGNRLRLAAQPYDPSSLGDEVDRSIAVFTKPFYAKRNAFAVSEDSPIFIVGMPRSGSTLAERVLGGHSEIEAAGELPVMPRMVESLSVEAGGVGRYRELLPEMSGQRIHELGALYVQRAREFRTTDRPRFTDKLHMNWRHIGLIHLILPKAKIIDVRRDAMDCCWSNYKLLFARGHPAASDFEHIARFYADYARMMDHMDVVAPGAVLRVQYEELVDDLECGTRRMLDYLGLPFEPECLDFQRSKDPVATASSEQVRRPLNREGVGAWKPYAEWLGPLRDALGPLAGD
ncbi:MAG: sulfotransferase [Sphingomicrobium sp.]